MSARLAVTLLALLTGCASFDADVVETRNTCVIDDDCVESMCSEGICVATEADALRIAYEVTPAVGGSMVLPASYRFAPEVVLAAQEDELVMPPGVRVLGTARLEQLRIPVDLIFTRRPTTAALPIGEREIVSTRTTEMQTTVLVGANRLDADYEAVLAAGEVYDLVVRPTTTLVTIDEQEQPAAEVFPPLSVNGLEVPRDGAVWPLNIAMPDVSRPCGEVADGCTLTGRVVSANAVGELVPEDGVQVRAISATDARPVSSIGRMVDGQFSIAIAPNVGDYLLRVTASADRPLFPEVLVDPAFFFPGEEPEILVPTLAPIEYGGRVETADGLDAPGTTLTFTAQDVFDDATGVVGRYTRTARTGEENGDPAAFSVSLLPGTYTVVVTPSRADSDDADPTDATAVLVEEVQLVAGSGIVQGQLFTLPAAQSIAGRVVDMNEVPAPGLAVSATALRTDVGVGPEASFNRNADTVVGPTGWFDLRVDPGGYDVVVRSGSQSAYPWIVVPSLVVGGEIESEALRYSLRAPVVLEGHVEDAGGTSLSGATVRVLAIVGPSAGMVPDEGDERTILLAETVTDEDGAFLLYAPSRLGGGEALR